MSFSDYFKDEIANDSLLGWNKSKVLFEYAIKAKDLPGATAEIGVYQGRTSKLIHSITPEKTHYCYDTFCGIKGADSSIDMHKDGEFSCDLDSVKAIINSDNVVYRVGFFPETFQEHDVQFSFVHTDTDTYIGTKETLAYFGPRMVKGGVIVFDDYGSWKCAGVEKAVHEFTATDTEFTHIPLGGYQFVMIKK